MRSRARRWSHTERKLRSEHGTLLAGIDEVGRGPLAGPVVACAIIMPAGGRTIPGVDDSKRVPEERRKELAVRIRERALALGLGAASVREIDTFNIYKATALAMTRALSRLCLRPNHIVV